MRIIGVLLCFLVCACGPPKDHRNEYQASNTYPLDAGFKEPIGVLMIERNGQMGAMGSIFLRDKERGIFATAEHVVPLETDYKIFFLGKVYRGVRVLDTGVADVGFFRISDDFDPSGFPEPYPIADSVSEGERVFIRGIHIHPPELQEGKLLHKIVRSYYELSGEQEFVYDNLPAIVMSKKKLMANSDVAGNDDDTLADVVLHNFVVVADQDHVSSFGGLSGGPTVNARGEAVGVNSTELASEGIRVLERNGLVRYFPRKTLNLLPLNELKRAFERLR